MRSQIAPPLVIRSEDDAEKMMMKTIMAIDKVSKNNRPVVGMIYAKFNSASDAGNHIQRLRATVNLYWLAVLKKDEPLAFISVISDEEPDTVDFFFADSVELAQQVARMRFPGHQFDF